MKNLKFVVIAFLFCFRANAQLQNDWDASEILTTMQKSWSVGNGCFENNFKVVDVYNGLELGGNNLEVMDALIQVFGDVTLYGEVMPVNASGELMLESIESVFYSCSGSLIKVYSETLSNETPEEVVNDLVLFPNPASEYFTLKGHNLKSFVMYNINGKVLLQVDDIIIQSKVIVEELSSGLYFIQATFENGSVKIKKFIKK